MKAICPTSGSATPYARAIAPETFLPMLHLRHRSRSVTLMLLVLAACTPAVVPVNVAPPDVTLRVARPMRVAVTGRDKARPTRGGAEGSIGTRRPIDASRAIEEAVGKALASDAPSAVAPQVIVQLRDFDVDWTTRKGFGISPVEITFTSLVQLEYDITGSNTHGVVVGRGRVVKIGAGARIDQRLHEFIDAAVSEAITAATSELVKDLDRNPHAGDAR